ncbi:MAG TPA: hypothetical protein VIG25_00025 [Pyrinomonadaceae bacterium]
MAEGPLRFYWVEFDEPQRDAEGDGPYFGAEIDSTFLSLERLSELSFMFIAAIQRALGADLPASDLYP